MQKWVVLCVGVLLGGCQKYAFEEQVGAVYEATRKEITINVPASSDILFVIDNSGSMAQKIDRVRNSVISFVEKLRGTGNSFRLSVTTTDNRDFSMCSDKTNIGKGADLIHDGVCGHLLAPKGKPAFLQSDQFNSAKEMADAFAEYLRRDNDTINTLGSPVEQPLKSAISAVSADLIGEGKPNAGVFRKDALLLVVIVTDESDCSFDDMSMSTAYKFSPMNTPAGYSCYSLGDSLRPTSAWVDDIVKAKAIIDGNQTPKKENVRVGLISASARDAAGSLYPASCRIKDNGPSDDCACFYEQTFPFCNYTKLKMPTVAGAGGLVCGVPGGDEANCCTAMANNRLFAFANSFENLKDTICQPDFSDSLLHLADLADRQCFDFEKAPLNDDPKNVQLRMRREGQKSYEDIPLTDPTMPSDGWFYLHGDGNPRACLSGTWKRQGKDTISLFVVSSADVGTAPATGPQAPTAQ